MAQIEDFDESQYLIQFIFGLRPEISRLVYLQQPASILAAKEMAERLELTHQAAAMHQKRTQAKKTNKTIRHRGTQEWRTGKRLRDQRRTFSAIRQQKESVPQHFGCTSARTRAFIGASYPENHGPAAMWGSLIKDLPQGDRTGYQRRIGSGATVDLVPLTRAK